MRLPSIREELQQEQPFPTPDHEAVVALLRTADVVYRAVTEATEAEGVSLEQYNVLRILRGAGDDGMATLEISKRMIQRDPGMTRLLGKLEKKSYVVRRRGEEDGRQVLCWITERGRACLKDLDVRVSQVVKTSFKGFTRARRDELLAILGQIRNHHR